VRDLGKGESKKMKRGKEWSQRKFGENEERERE
jgi:hypothetical protein